VLSQPPVHHSARFHNRDISSQIAQKRILTHCLALEQASTVRSVCLGGAPVVVSKAKLKRKMPMTAKTGLDALLTPERSVLLLIDHQAFQFSNLHSHEPTLILNNVVEM